MGKDFEKPIILDASLSRYQQIKEIIHAKIMGREWQPGQLIPSENELARAFNVSKNTVVRAIIDLKNAEVLHRVQGKGTFVAHPGEKLTTHQLVGLLVRARGHLYGTLSRYLIQNLQREDYYPVLLDPTAYDNLEDGSRKLDRFLASHPASIIIDGGVVDFPFEWLDGKEQILKNLIFIHRFEDEKRAYNARFVLSDYKFGGHLAINHLLELGHKKIALFTYYHPAAEGNPPSMPRNLIHRELLQGCQEAMGEKGLDPATHLEVIFDFEPGQECLVKSLTSPDRPTAIFSFGDNRAQAISRVARKLNLRIPEDLAILGYYNTPWVEMLDVPLSSISIQEDELARVAAGMIRGTTQYPRQFPDENERVYVKPKLVIRESCGASIKK